MNNFRLAHFSDIHMPPMLKPTLLEIISTRILGLSSWVFNRKKIHMINVFQAFEKDIKKQKIDHYAFSGDLLNIASKAEIKRATKWLYNFAPSHKISFVPGNHDAYTKDSITNIFYHWQDYMKSCNIGNKILKKLNINLTNKIPYGPFPYIRIFKKIALIGVSSAYVSPPFMATGKVGEEQRNRLIKILNYLKKENFFKIIMIHHPPLPYLTSNIRGLKDSAELKDILIDIGVEIIIYGHNHQNKITNINNKFGLSLCIGVSSASAIKTNKKPAASYNKLLINQNKKEWQVNLLKHEYIIQRNNFIETKVKALGFWYFI